MTLNITGNAIIPYTPSAGASSSRGMAVRPSPPREIEDSARLRSESRARRREAQAEGGDTETGVASRMSLRLATPAVPSDDTPPSTRRALTTYLDNENVTRFDANADYLGRVDVFA